MSHLYNLANWKIRFERSISITFGCGDACLYWIAWIHSDESI